MVNQKLSRGSIPLSNISESDLTIEMRRYIVPMANNQPSPPIISSDFPKGEVLRGDVLAKTRPEIEHQFDEKVAWSSKSRTRRVIA
jgi:hypothetical protein